MSSAARANPLGPLLKSSGTLGAAALLALLVLCPMGCERTAASSQVPAAVAASNTYLEAAAREFLGPDLPVLRLAEPGTCPGHFDLRPSQVEDLRAARLLLRFDFQKSLDAKLERVAESGLRIGSVVPPGALCEPDSYLAACRQTGEALVQAGLLDRSATDETIAAIQRRLADEVTWARRRIDGARLSGAAVVTSEHQAGFCKFLGLKVLAQFRGADLASIEEIDQAARAAHPRAIVANQPQGRGLADALAVRLGAPVVVLANFPDPHTHGCRFDDLFRDNVLRLIDVASQ